MFRPDRPIRSYLLWLFAASLLVVGIPQYSNAQKIGSFLGSNGPDLLDLSRKKASCCSAAEVDTTAFTAFAAPEYDTYRLTATYYSLRGGLTTTLMLNNKGAQPILAVPTFYSLAGTRLQLAPITVPAASYIDVDMQELLSEAADEFQEGSMKIAYEGISQQLGAQVKMTDATNSLIWAEQFIYASKFVSSRLENLWWLPFQNPDTKVVVSNTSSGTIMASMTVEGTSPHQSGPLLISLAPWETRVLDILRDIAGRENGHIHDKGGISITHSGAPGAILARMFISKPNKGYSAAVNFIDPDAAASQRWHGNGLRFRHLNGQKLEPVLAVRNTGDQTSRVKGRILFTRLNGNTDSINIPEKNIAPGNTKLIDLENLIADIPNAIQHGGIELEYDTPKGTIITSVQSVSQNGDHVFQVPMYDPQNMPSSAGGFPWKADGDFTTLVYIKNETDIESKYTVHLNFEGGGYTLGVEKLKANQTAEIDFRKLRDEQVPDEMGNLIPLNLDKGQIAWSVKGGVNKILSGRSEQISLSRGIASTYACANCCADSVFQTGILPTGTQYTAVGGIEQFAAQQHDINCMNQFQPWYYPADVIWESTEPPVALVDGEGLAEAVGTGFSIIRASWESVTWTNFGTYCDPTYNAEEEAAIIEVVGVQKIQYKVGSTWTDIPSGGLGPFCHGTSVDLRAVPTSGSFPSGKPTWGGDASGTGAEKTVIFSTGGARTVSATSGNTVLATVNVGPANANINITWASPVVTMSSTTGDSETVNKPFVEEYSACAEPASNLWRLRVKKVDGGTNMLIRTGGSRNPSTSPPTSQSEAIDANEVMNEYFLNGRGTWHTSAATLAHEHHHDAQWKCSGDHYWPATEADIEALTVSYTSHNTEASAINQMKGNGANSRFTSFVNTAGSYFISLPDSPGSRPYAAGQLVLNGNITAIVALATTNGWTGIPGVAATPNASNPCHLSFP